MGQGEEVATGGGPMSRSAAPDRRGARPRGSLRRRIALWAVVLVALPTVLCAVWLNRITQRSMSRSHVQTVRLLGQTLSGALAGRIDEGWSPASDAVIDAAVGDPRVVLAVVTDKHGQLLHRRVTDSQAYERILNAGLKGLDMDLDIGRPRRLGDQGQLVVLKTPIWRPEEGRRIGMATSHALTGRPTRSQSVLGAAFGAMARPVSPTDEVVSSHAEDRQLEGFVLLGVYDRSLPTMLSRLERTQLTAAGLVCLAAVPLLLWLAHRWTRPVRAMLGATAELANGRPTKPVPEHDRDELGLLGRAFNKMAQRLTEARRALEQHNQALEQQVHERTAELAQANEALAEQIKDKDTLLRAVSHDLGAPLRNIDGMASMVLRKYRDDLAEDAVVKLERISSNVQAQTQLIGELVQDSRHTAAQSKSTTAANQSRSAPEAASPRTALPQPHAEDEAGSSHTAPQSAPKASSACSMAADDADSVDIDSTDKVDIRQLIEQIGESLSYELETGQIDLRIVGQFPSLQVDPIRIRQVFQNLIDNAAKYMADRPVRRITVGAQSQGEGVHLFHVSDTGGGIAMEDMPGLFQAYQRGGQWADSQIEGAGVGLASIKVIIEGYGGQIWARSQPGRGSTFTFTLAPRAAAYGKSTTITRCRSESVIPAQAGIQPFTR